MIYCKCNFFDKKVFLDYNEYEEKKGEVDWSRFDGPCSLNLNNPPHRQPYYFYAVVNVNYTMSLQELIPYNSGHKTINDIL